MAKVDVTLVNAQDGEEWPAEVVVDKPVGWWLGDILAQLGLPREVEGQPVSYRFFVERTERAVTEEETLEIAGLLEGDVVRLERVAAQAPSVDTDSAAASFSAAAQMPQVRPIPADAVPRVKRFGWRIALLCVVGSLLGGTLGWTSYCALMDSYSWSVATFSLWAIWYGIWAAVLGPSLKPRRAWALLAVGTAGLGVLGALIGTFEGGTAYSLGWVVVGAIWGWAIAMACALRPIEGALLALLGALPLGAAGILSAMEVFTWDEVCYTEFLRLEEVFDVLYVVYGLVPGVLIGGALGFLGGRQEG
jgi:hypothetical protein